MNSSALLLEPPDKQDFDEAIRNAEISIPTPAAGIEWAVAAATFGVLLHRYTGSTSVSFDVILDSICGAGARQSRVELDIGGASTLAFLAASIELALAPSPAILAVNCLVPQNLCRFFQVKQTAPSYEHPILISFSLQNNVAAALHFAAGIYDDQLIAALSKHMERLLEAASKSPDARISEFPMMSPDELHHLLVELNGPTIDFDRLTIPDAFELQVNNMPDAPAIKFNDQVITFKELHSMTAAAAFVLQENGVESESLVGVYIDDPAAVAITYFAIVIAGGVLVPLDPEWPEDRLHQVVQNAGLRVMVTTDHLRTNLPPDVAHTLLYGALRSDSSNHRFVKPALTPNSAAYIVHTSGSTGLPKGVVGLHRTITSAPVAAIPMEKDEVYALSANLTFGSGVVGLFHPIIQGAAVLLVTRQLAKDLPRLVDNWERASATRIVMVPPQLRELCLVKGIRKKLQKVRVVILVGAPLNADLLPEVYELFPQAAVTNGYTCLEVGTMTTRWESWPDARRLSLTVGAPLPNIRVYVLGTNGSPLPLGMPGEIYVGSADLSRGYLNQPELTQERFLPNPFPAPGISRVYRTGDTGRLLPSGELEWLGRVDNQVKVRGVRIELEEIELALQAHPDIQHAAVVPVPHEGDSRLIAFVAPKPGRSLLVSALRKHLASGLPSFCIPSSLVIADQLPLTRNGKVDRRSLPKVSLTRPEIDTPFVAPRNATEQAMQQVWEQELGFEGIGINDHFLELGGDSLLAVRVAIGIEERLSVEVPVASVFELPTIAQLAENLVSLTCSDRVR